jgi:hypothetical protein
MSGAHLAIHARQREAKRNQEEEEMTPYSQEDLSKGWEFKIVRSMTGSFRSPQAFQRMLQEEAQAGWELAEKFDDSRVRLKRPEGARRRDISLPDRIDPYRTQYGISEGQLALIILAASGLLGGLIMLAVYLFGG